MTEIPSDTTAFIVVMCVALLIVPGTILGVIPRPGPELQDTGPGLATLFFPLFHSFQVCTRGAGVSHILAITCSNLTPILTNDKTRYREAAKRLLVPSWSYIPVLSLEGNT